LINATDQTYLLNEQYKDASNLDARARVHELYSTNKHGWHRWVFEQLTLPGATRILELGAGPGLLWSHNLGRIPGGCQAVLSDLSSGIVNQARQTLGVSTAQFRFVVADVQRIPFADAAFDVLVANHMLYHVLDREKALAEIHRVLRPGGRLYASTVGQAHLRELTELVERYAPRRESWTNEFSLENGAKQLARRFSQVTLLRYEDCLVVTEVAPLVDYVRSGGYGLTEEGLEEFSQAVAREIKEHGAFRIAKDSGLFQAIRPDSSDSGTNLP